MLSENADALMAVANAGGASPYDCAVNLAKMRMAAPVIFHSGIGITDEERAAKMIHILMLQNRRAVGRRWVGHRVWKVSDLSGVAQHLVGSECKVLKTELGIKGNANHWDSRIGPRKLWQGALFIIKNFGGWDGQLMRTKREEERCAKADFKQRRARLILKIDRVEESLQRLPQELQGLKQKLQQIRDDEDERAKWQAPKAKRVKCAHTT